MQSTFDQKHLMGQQFVGWEPLNLLRNHAHHAPAQAGVYVVTWSGVGPAFLERSVGGHFKGKDPTVATDLLAESWVDGTPVVYIGRATNLRARLKLLARFGAGEPVAHWGGRYLWQLADHDRLCVAWRTEHDPVAAEHELLDEFEQAFGQLPFANLVRGTRPVLAA